MAFKTTITSALAASVIALAMACSPAPAPKTGAEAEQANAVVVAAVAEQRERFASAKPVSEADPATAYQFQFEGLSTPTVPLTAFEGDVLLVVNTASKCGFTPQYEGLQDIYAEYHDQGFEVLGVPANNFNSQEPGTAEEIREFCSINFGVTFPMAGKTDVVGENAHPFYRWAEAQLGDAAVPQWNFHKLLIGRDGRLIAAFPTRTTPTSDEVRAAITQALGS